MFFQLDKHLFTHLEIVQMTDGQMTTGQLTIPQCLPMSILHKSYF